jgi:TM2 domain-containing membrane protein YozV
MNEEIKICPDCAEEVRAAARKCRYCGHAFDPSLAAVPMPVQVVGGLKIKNNNLLAALLSAIVPGLGQILKGEATTGVIWFIACLIGFIFYVIPGVIVYVLCIQNAYTGRVPDWFPRFMRPENYAQQQQPPSAPQPTEAALRTDRRESESGLTILGINNK